VVAVVGVRACCGIGPNAANYINSIVTTKEVRHVLHVRLYTSDPGSVESRRGADVIALRYGRQ